MKIKIAIVLIFSILLFSYNSFAQDKTWDDFDKGLFSTFVALNVIDYAQTTYIFDNEEYYELNPIIVKLDDKMGQTGILLYFTSCTIGSYFIADWLKPKHRKIFW